MRVAGLYKAVVYFLLRLHIGIPLLIGRIRGCYLGAGIRDHHIGRHILALLLQLVHGVEGSEGTIAVNGPGEVCPTSAAIAGAPDYSVISGEKICPLIHGLFSNIRHNRGRAELFNLGLLLWIADEGVDLVAGVNQLRGGQQSDLAVSTDVQNLLLISHASPP